MWAVFALGAALLTSFNPILYKRMLRDVDTFTVVWAVTLLGLPLLGIFTLLLTPQMPRLDWVFLFAGLLSAITLILEKTATQHMHPSSPRFAAFSLRLTYRGTFISLG